MWLSDYLFVILFAKTDQRFSTTNHFKNKNLACACKPQIYAMKKGSMFDISGARTYI